MTDVIFGNGIGKDDLSPIAGFEFCVGDSTAACNVVPPYRFAAPAENTSGVAADGEMVAEGILFANAELSAGT